MQNATLPLARRHAALSALSVLFGVAALSGCLREAPVQDLTPASPWYPESHAQLLEQGRLSQATRQRSVFAELGDGRGGTWLRYSLEEVIRRLEPEDLPYESEHSLAVRLLISEVGADRLLSNVWAREEAAGILYTVENRLDQAAWNPADIEGAPHFPGCGEYGDYASCVDAEQYLGMATWRALNPARGYEAEELAQAVDQAMLAWYLVQERLIDDPGEGAVEYRHLCGDEGYGAPTWACDAHMGRPGGDIPGANPHTGPVLFMALGDYLPQYGFYERYDSALVDYAPVEPVVAH